VGPAAPGPPGTPPGAKDPDSPQLDAALRILADYVAASRHVALNP